MNHDDKIFVAGHNGLVGSAILRELKRLGYLNVLVADRSELNLLSETAVRSFFTHHRPDYVFLAAAKVGGIKANNALRANFLYENLTIQNNVIWNAYQAQVG